MTFCWYLPLSATIHPSNLLCTFWVYLLMGTQRSAPLNIILIFIFGYEPFSVVLHFHNHKDVNEPSSSAG